ncbi:MAG: hypothetical protein AAF250_06405 [Pseudomonadota bacterium]
MFEKTIPISEDQSGLHGRDSIPGDMLIGSRDRVPGKGGDALRAIEWNELTARLNAARDLRRVLRRDARINIEGTAASFGDAAATYFQSLEHGERPVNPVALEASKASPGITHETKGNAATGDARDD